MSEDIWIEAEFQLEDYPIGTKAKAFGGGYWIKVLHGWKWFCGSTFPNPGGDWTGEICLPQE